MVKCGSCDEPWDIMSSTFHCSCGHAFSAGDVHLAIDRLVDTCRRLLDILEGSAKANNLFAKRTETSFRGFMASVVEGLGEAAGFVVGKLLGRFLG